jgi:hypothetical protein
MVVLAVAAAGAVGCALTVTVVGAEIHVISVVRLTRIVCGPDDTPAKVRESLYVPPSILYSYPAPRGALIVIVPVARAHVGWIVVLAVAAAGAVGCALIKTLVVGTDVHPDALETVKL